MGCKPAPAQAMDCERGLGSTSFQNSRNWIGLGLVFHLCLVGQRSLGASARG